MSETIILSDDQYQLNIKRVLAYKEQLHSKDGEAQLNYLMHDRGLSRDTIEKFHLGAVLDPDPVDRPAVGRISIPITNLRGPVSIRFRACGAGDPKYWSPAGTKTALFNVAELATALDYVVITEGEIDCMTLSQCGIPAIGVSGAQAWKSHHRFLLEGLRRVYVAGDGDEAGRSFTEKVADQVPGPHPIALPQGADINDIYRSGGADAVREIIGLKED